MLEQAYTEGYETCLAELGLSKEAKNPFPGEEAWKVLRGGGSKVKPTLKAPAERTIDYSSWTGGVKAGKPMKAEYTAKPAALSPKAQKAMEAFDYAKSKNIKSIVGAK